MSIDLEYAIKQDVRNNPVVREVDLDQKREFVRTLGWAALVVAMLMFELWPHTTLQADDRRLVALRAELAQEHVNHRQYQLELARLLNPELLRPRAMNELQMVEPNVGAMLVLPRVTEPARASRAIVASAR